MENETAVAISTRGRHSVLSHSVNQWKKHYPDIELIIVEDNGETPRGIAKTKNLCLDALIDTGRKHLFLADDDIYPTDNEGLLRYAKSPHKHMCFSFEKDHTGRRISEDVYVKRVIRGHNIFNSPCGCLLYLERSVLMGGIRYDENFEIWGKEHKDFSVRIRKSGMTQYYFIDIVDSDKHFYSHDQHGTVSSSVPEKIRIESIKKNTEYFNRKWGEL